MRLAIICSGQAGQHRGMLDELLSDPECESVRVAASAALGQDFTQWWRALDDKEIFLNAHAQLAIAFYQIATWKRISNLLPQVSLLAGYSLGELIAYHIAGALDAAETFRLVRARAQLMDEAMAGSDSGGGCMVLWRGRVSPATLAQRNALVAKYGLSIAIKRRNGEEVLAAPAAAIAQFVAEMMPLNPNLRRLPVAIPSHTHYLAAAANSFNVVLNNSTLSAPQITVLGGLDAAPIRTRELAIQTLSQQMATTIRWDSCMETLAESGIEKVIELGPGNDLAKLLEAEYPFIQARAVSDFGDYHALSGWLE